MKFLKRARLAIIPSVFGHVAGGGDVPEDTAFMEKEVTEFLKGQ